LPVIRQGLWKPGRDPIESQAHLDFLRSDVDVEYRYLTGQVPT
jgi:hypothetical protein